MIFWLFAYLVALGLLLAFFRGARLLDEADPQYSASEPAAEPRRRPDTTQLELPIVSEPYPARQWHGAAWISASSRPDAN
jgi:hypothetical protein